MKKRFKYFSMLLLFFSLNFNGLGQETTGSVEGIVKDPQGAIVPNVPIKITGVSIGFSRTISSDKDGSFRILQVPPGEYKISTEAASGFSASEPQIVTVTLGKAVIVNLGVSIAGQTAQVDITADAQTIDPSESKIQTNISAKTVELLPRGTNFSSLLKVSPATRSEPLSGQFQVDGASGSENSFVVDGQEVSNFRTGVLNGNNNLPFQFVQEVQIKTNGFEAEFGGASGGVISVVTKGGSNDWHGDFGFQFQPSKLQAGPNPLLSNISNGSGTNNRQRVEYLPLKRDSFVNYFPSAVFSGPILKDRLWFFSSYTPQFFDTERTSEYYSVPTATSTPTLTTTETYRVKQKNDFAFFRLDASPSDNLRLSASYTYNPIAVEGLIPDAQIVYNGAPPSVDFGGTTGLIKGRQFTDLQGGRQNGANINAQAVWTPNDNWILGFRYGRGFLNEKLASYGVPTGLSSAFDTTSNTRFRCRVGAAIGGCSSGFQNLPPLQYRNKDVSIRNSFDVDATVQIANFAGRHSLKVGYQYATLLNDVDARTIDQVNFYYGFSLADIGAPLADSPNSIGAGFLQRFATIGKASNKRQSLYAQDSWHPFQRLTLNLGVRAEKENLPAFNEFAPPISFGFGDKIAPRLGFAVDLTGDGKTKLFGSYGIFYDSLKFDLPRGSFGGDFFRVDYFEILSDHPEYTYYTPDKILGNYSDPIGGACPISGSIGLSICQFDFRIASNSPNADIFSGQVDPNLKPFRQSEFTFGLERELTRNYQISARYTHKQVDSAIEDAGFPTADGSEAYIISNPGKGLYAELSKLFGYAKLTTPERKFDAVEVKFDKRFSNNYFYQLNYTYSRLFGNYSGLASSDELGRTSPSVNRFFDLPFIGFDADGRPDNGLLATDRPHVFNAFGAYVYDWLGKKNNSTEFSLFTTIASGTPKTTFFTFYRAGTILNGRGDLGRTETFTQTDAAITHRYKFGRDSRFTFALDFNVINLFNERNVIAVNQSITSPSISIDGKSLNIAGGETDIINILLTQGLRTQINAALNNPANAHFRDNSYGLPNAFQGGRTVRFGARLSF